MDKILIGQIVNAVGLKGEVKVYSYAGQKERYEDLAFVYAESSKYVIEQVRYNKDLVILKLSGINDRTAAEGMKNSNIFIDEAQLPELPADTYFIRDLIGLRVRDEQGKTMGRLTDVIQNRAQDLYEIEMEDRKKILVPAVEEFILNIDVKEGFIEVKLIEGLIG